MSYSNLKIDRTQIVSSVYEKCTMDGYEEYKIGSIENLDGKRHRLNIEVDSRKFFLDFFFNSDYRTTVQTGQGSNTDLQEIFAKHISEDLNLLSEDYININKRFEAQLGIGKKANDTIVYKNLEEDTFNKLITIVEADEICKRVEVIRDEETVSIIKLYDANENEVTVSHFSSYGHTIMLQGSPKVLFAVCAAEVAGLIGREENIEALNEFYGTNTSLEEIEQEYEEMFANAKAFIGVKLKKCICQALQNRRDLGEKFDPTYLAAPAERALEGHIRYILAGKLTGDNINTFEPCEYDTNGNPIKWQLQKAHWPHLGNDLHKINCLGSAYTYMKLVRNRLFHWDNPTVFGVDTTKMLVSEEVDKTIMDALKLIEEYYS